MEDNLVKKRKPAKPKKTEAEMLLRLRKRLTYDSGTGPAHAYIEKVRNAAGFDATRTIDAMSMSLWPSRGLRLSAYEIKCSRADTLKEIRTPAKAEVFMPFVDFFWLVVADPDFVKPGELPETWGLMTCHGAGLTVVKEAPLNEAACAPDRSLLAALLRQAGVAAATQPELDQARQQGRVEGKEQAEQQRGWARDRTKQRLEHFEERDNKVMEMLGNDLASVLRGRPDDFLRAVKAALDGQRDLDHMRHRLQRLGADAKVLAAQTDRILADHFPTEEPS